MIFTNYKRLHFGDWLITVSCFNGCLYTVVAYNANTDTTISIDSMWANENDAFNAITGKLKILSPVVNR